MDKLIQFSDDTTLTFKEKPVEILLQKAHLRQVIATNQYLSKNNVPINSNKTKCMCFNIKQCTDQAPSVLLYEQELEEVIYSPFAILIDYDK